MLSSSKMEKFVALHTEDSPWLLCSIFLLISMMDLLSLLNYMHICNVLVYGFLIVSCSFACVPVTFMVV